jgi:starch phosphorylase
LVAAGLEVFSNDLVALMLTNYTEELKIPVSEVVKLGLVQESSTFSMTMLALRMAGKVNAVSKLHTKKASEIWTNHPIIAITNGIHINTWDKVKDIKNHKIYKEELLKYIQKETNVKWSSNDLLLGWARRFVEYKRPLSILEDIDRFMTIAQNPKYPVKIVFSGEPHENNEDGKEMLQKLENLIKDKIGDSAVYLPHYNMNITEKMVAGCDVWLNTPIVGFEACGTSGMKAALNGVLPCSTRDGWVDEVDLNGIGWILDTDHLSTNILDVLEKDIVPMYYEHQEEWQVRMQNARQMILDKFSTERMLREYMEKLYQPS